MSSRLSRLEKKLKSLIHPPLHMKPENSYPTRNYYLWICAGIVTLNQFILFSFTSFRWCHLWYGKRLAAAFLCIFSDCWHKSICGSWGTPGSYLLQCVRLKNLLVLMWVGFRRAQFSELALVEVKFARLHH
jgi:hypothetical protein